AAAAATAAEATTGAATRAGGGRINDFRPWRTAGNRPPRGTSDLPLTSHAPLVTLYGEACAPLDQGGSDRVLSHPGETPGLAGRGDLRRPRRPPALPRPLLHPGPRRVRPGVLRSPRRGGARPRALHLAAALARGAGRRPLDAPDQPEHPDQSQG